MSDRGILITFLRRMRVVVPMLFALALFLALRVDGSDVLFTLAGVTVTQEALASAGDAMLRLFCIASASILFTLLVPMPHAVDGMRRLHLPDRVISVAWLTERFLALLGAELARVTDGVRARSARMSLPRRVLLAARLSGSFLLRAVGRSERLADAMTARGFDGRIPPHVSARWSPRDSITAIAALGAILFSLAW